MKVSMAKRRGSDALPRVRRCKSQRFFSLLRADLLELASSKFSPCPATAEVEDEDELEDDYD
jgi:hypothetical protein